MNLLKIAGAGVVVAAMVGLSACTAPPITPVITPVVQEANDLQGATVDLIVGQVLVINTGSLAVDSYSGKVKDEKVAKFEPGREESTATFNPGVTALAPGSTEVVMSNKDGGIQPLTFTVKVTEAKK